MASITLPDGTKVPVKKGETVGKLATIIGIGLGKAALGGQVDDEIVDLSYKLDKDASVKILTFKDEEGVEIFNHSAAHILMHALQRLYKAIPGVGPAIADGFYHDFDCKTTISLDDLPKIEAEMKKIIKEDLEIKKKLMPIAKAIKFLKDKGFKYTVELAEELKEQGEKEIAFYEQGDFINMCKGPHVPSTGKIQAVKLLKTSGAYWKGDSKNKQLQRIYGIAFSEEKQLKKHLTLLEEAEKRDHRIIGKQMELFSIHDEAPGMPFFHDKGNFIWEKLKSFMNCEMRKLGYEVNKTPIILSKQLWIQSGHWDHYKDAMYFTKIDEQDYAIKPMNCPGNLLIFKTKLHSYKELPIKAGEFGLVHRHELSGVLSGLFRVRVFTQDDAHIFCTEEQIQEQIIELFDLVEKIYSTFGFKYEVELSTRPAKAMGSKKIWDIAEKALEDALKAKKIKYKLNPGEGAFYGPKIDFHIKDTLNRSWQCGTIQLDFSMPEKFDLTYEGEDGKKHRPVMIHRAIYGSIERFLGILIEHFAGWFPLWISPIQARVIAVSDKFNKYAENTYKELKDAGIRVEFDSRAESTGKKVRDSQIQKIPILINIGEKEQKAKTLAVRTNSDGKVKFGVKLDALIKKIQKNVDDKEIEFKL